MLNQFFNISDKEILALFFKIFGVVFCLLFFIYAVVIFRQIKIMARTVQVIDTGVVKREGLIIFITRLQVFVSLFLLIFSLMIIFS